LRAAVVDLGFNSAKMVCYNIEPNGEFEAYRQVAYKVQLGEGLSESGTLAPEPMRRTIERLKVLRDIADLDSVRQVIPVATSAVREASNSEEFVREMRRQTGFAFRVLSADEEALLSYAGAVGFSGFPDVVFFDLGGGSLEIVRAVGFRVKTLTSIPLGALRLNYSYGNGDGTFSKSGLRLMKERIESLLPKGEAMRINGRTKLVGVGGTVRAIARYDQVLTGYPFSKVHGYQIPYESASSISRMFLKMSSRDLSRVNAVGNRAETIAAGAYVVKTLMKRLGLDSLTVSSHGLREGALAIYMTAPKLFHSGPVLQSQVELYVESAGHSVPQSKSGAVEAFASTGLIDGSESAMLCEGRRLMAGATHTTDLQTLFFSILGEDSRLDHADQLLMALVVVHSMNERAAESLLEEYRRFLPKEKRKSLGRLSAIYSMSDALERAEAEAKLLLSSHELRILVRPASPRPVQSFLNAQAESLGHDLGLDVVVTFRPPASIQSRLDEGAGQV